MQKSVVIVLLLWINFVFAQKDLDFFPKPHPWRGNNEFLNQVLKKYPVADTIYFKIPLTFWIYTDKNGFGPGPVQIKQQLKMLNKFFNTYNHTGLYFYVAQINFVKNKRHLTMGYFFENFFTTLKNHIPGTVNIHLVRKIKIFSSNNNIGGTYNSLTHALVITTANFPTGLAHEMGHYFGLLHPHRNWNKGKLLAESVSRTRTVPFSKKRNCEVRGDYLCDTQAQPDLSLFCDENCNYTGHITDPWHQPYHPDTDNIMSYFKNKHCRKHFTHMQIAVMLYNVSTSKYAKLWRNIPQNKHFFPDNYEPDNFPQIASLLLPGQVQYHNFNCFDNGRQLLMDDADFFKINFIRTRSTFLEISKAQNLFPQMKLTIYDNFLVPVYTKIIADPTVFKLPDLEPNIYYIKIQQINRLQKCQLYDYKIKLTIY